MPQPQRGAAPAGHHFGRRALLAASGSALLAAAGCGSKSSSLSSASTTRPVQTDHGVVQVPTAPQRVITTYTDMLDIAVALGLPLVASPGARGSAKNPFPKFLPSEPLKNTVRLSTYPEQSIESLAAHHPDLIINDFPDLSDKLPPIATTVSFDDEDPTQHAWQRTITALAPAFGKEALAQKFISERQSKADEVRRAIAGGTFAGATFASGYASDKGFYLYGDAVAPSPMLKEVGLKQIKGAPSATAKESTRLLSMERLGDLAAADVLFVTSNPPAGGYEPDLTEQAAVRSSRLWKSLPAVKAGHFVDFPVDLVFPGPYCDQALLDLIHTHLS